MLTPRDLARLDKRFHDFGYLVQLPETLASVADARTPAELDCETVAGIREIALPHKLQPETWPAIRSAAERIGAEIEAEETGNWIDER